MHLTPAIFSWKFNSPIRCYSPQTHVPCSINWQKELRSDGEKSVVHEIVWKSHAAQRRLHPFIDTCMFNNKLFQCCPIGTMLTIWCLIYMMINKNGSIPKRFFDIFLSTFTWRVAQGRNEKFPIQCIATT